MKYIKEYKEIGSRLLFTQEEFDDIRDIFRDITDDHNLVLSKCVEDFKSDDEYDDIPDECYYRIKLYDKSNCYTSDISKATSIIIIIFPSSIELLDKLNSDIDIFVKRIISMGLRCYRDIARKYYVINIEK